MLIVIAGLSMISGCVLMMLGPIAAGLEQWEAELVQRRRELARRREVLRGLDSPPPPPPQGPYR